MGQKKPASKKRKLQEASSSGPKLAYDPDKFVSQKAWERFNEYKARATKPIQERGFAADFGGYARFEEQVKEMQWESIAAHPDQGHLDLVREFYSNTWASTTSNPQNSGKVSKVSVRGKIIDFSAEALQAALVIIGVDPKDCPFQKLKVKSDREAISLTICTGPHLISTLGTGDLLTERIFLKSEARVWMFFINTRILPSTNVNRITGDRIFLLYCLMTGQRVHLGSIVYSEIQQAACLKKLWYPALINRLCTAAGVHVKKGEEKIPRGNAIKRVWVQAILAGREIEAEDLGLDKRPVTQQRFTKSLNDRLNRIEAKQESLAKMIVHLGRETFKGFKAVFEAVRCSNAPGPEEFEEPDITWFQQRGKEPAEEDDDDIEENEDEAAFLDEDVDLSG